MAPTTPSFTTPSHRVPTDLAAVVAVCLATAAAIALDAPSLVRVPLALLTAFVLPGYVVGVALFPAGESGRPAGDDRDERDRPHRGLDLLERAVLTVGLSVAIVSLAGVVVDQVTTITVWTLLAGVLAVTLGTVPPAWYRRRRVPEPDRFAPVEDRRAPFSGRDDGTGTGWRTLALYTILVASLVFAAGALAVSGAGGFGSAGADETGPSTTELYFVDEDDEAQGSQYPTEFVQGEPRRTSLAIGNQEGEDRTYTVVGQLQIVDRTDPELRVRDRRTLERSQVAVPNGSTQTLTNWVTVNVQSDDLRIVYLLYPGEPPAEPTMDNAYREVHLWINVTDGNATRNQTTGETPAQLTAA